jgi:hypothetical protein
VKEIWFRAGENNRLKTRTLSRLTKYLNGKYIIVDDDGNSRAQKGLGEQRAQRAPAAEVQGQGDHRLSVRRSETAGIGEFDADQWEQPGSVGADLPVRWIRQPDG